MGLGSGVAVSCGVVHRCSSDPALLWLWCRPAAAAPIQPLSWELPYAAHVALRKRERDGGRERETERNEPTMYLEQLDTKNIVVE